MRLAIGILPACILACSFASRAPQDQRRTWQERQAAALAPAELKRERPRWGRRTTLRVRVHVAEAGSKSAARRQDEFEELVERANQVLLPTLDAQLEVESFQAWTPRSSVEALVDMLTEIEQHDRGEDVDWVIALVGASPVATMSFHDLGLARVLGKHVVLRSMEDAGEVRTLDEGLDALSAEERATLVAKRRRHRLLVMFLHELGHLLGAVHVRDAHWIMNPVYDESMEAYAPANRELMRKVIQFKSREDGDPAELHRALQTYLEEERGWGGWVEEDLAQMMASLRGASAAKLPSPEVEPVEVDPATNVEGLPPEDAEAFARLRQRVSDGDVAKAWDEIAALADKHPARYALQHLACQSAWQARVARKTWSTYCDRMMETAKQLPAENSGTSRRR